MACFNTLHLESPERVDPFEFQQQQLKPLGNITVMEYENHIPDGYREAYDKLIFVVRMAPDAITKKKLLDSFSQKFTMLSYLWEQRIALDLPPEPVTVTKEVYERCLKLKKKALQQFFYHRYLLCLPGRLQKPCKPEKMQKLVQVYQLPYVEVLSKICDIKLKEAFRILACKKMEPFLTFPHHQLSRFYRHYQRNSGTPLPADIKEKYDKAVKSYQEMITVAMKPYEWIEWMKLNFGEEHWIPNFECKLGEHYFLREIWYEYVVYLDGKKNIECLNVLKRYCRLFITEEYMRSRYYETTKRYQAEGYNVLPWLLDQAQLEVDFFYGEAGLPKLKALLKEECLTQICRECFEIKNNQYFNGQLSYYKSSALLFWRKKKELISETCFLCGCFKDGTLKNGGEECAEIDERNKEMVFRKSLADLRATAIKFHSIVKIQFHDSLDPSIPLPIFHYLLENANHQVLSKIYATAKYFFIKQKILLCYRIHISSNTTEKYMEQALSTNVKAILKSPFKKYCCGATLSFRDSSNPNLLSKCLSKLCCCSLTNLVISGQNLTVDEFAYLLSSGKMEQIELKEVRIFKENGKMLKIEEIIAMLPTVIDLTINTKSRQIFTLQTAQNISQLFRDGKKFESFQLYHIPDNFHLGWFQQFLKIHMQPRGYLRLKLRENVNPLFRNLYKHFLTVIKFDWQPAYQGPQLGYYD